MDIKTDVCTVTVFFHVHATTIHIYTHHSNMRTGDMTLDLCGKVANYGTSVRSPGAKWIIKGGVARMTGDMWNALRQACPITSHHTTNPKRNLPEINPDLLSEKPASKSPNAPRYGKMLFMFISSSLSLKKILVFCAELAVVKEDMKRKGRV